jgi:hypothetical protein
MIGGARVVHLADPFTLPTRDAAPAPIAQPSDPLAELARAVREIRETLARPAPALGLGEIMPLLSAIITRPPEIGLKDVLALMAKNDTRGSVSELIGAVKEIRELAALEAPAAGGDSLGQIVGAFAPMFAAGIQQQQAQQQQQAARPALAAAPRPITQQPAPQAAGTAPAVQQPAPAAGGGVLESLADLAPLLAKAARHNAEPATYADVIADALEAEGTFEQAADQLRQLAPGNLAAALAATVPALEQAGPWLVHVEAALRELIDQPAAAADEPAPAQEAQQ